MAKKVRKHKKRHSSHHHHRKKHPLPANLISGLVYATAAIVCISLGALLYKGVKAAEKEMESKDQPQRSVSSSHLPPGATVVKRRGEGRKRTLTYEKAEPDDSRKEKKSERKPRPAPKPKIKQPEKIEDLPVTPVAKEKPKGPPTPLPKPRPKWESPDQNLREPQILTLVPLADTTIVVAPETMRDRNGGSMDDLVIKDNESFVLTKFDINPVRGWSIRRAVWHAKVKKGTVKEVSFSTIMSDWSEGTGKLEKEATAGATFQWADHRKLPWSQDQLPVTYVSRGNNQSRYCMTFPQTTEGQTSEWVALEIEPELVQALVAGAAYGFAITDEKTGAAATPINFFSRETPDSHYLEVEGQLVDITPPGAITDLQCFAHPHLERRSGVGVILRWTATGDDRDSGQAFRYDIRYSAHGEPFERATQLPLTASPYPPVPSGETDEVVITDLDPNTTYTFYVQAVDKSGQGGDVAEVEFTTGSRLKTDTPTEPLSYKLDSLEILNRSFAIQILDEFEGIDPTSGDRTDSLQSGARPRDTSFLWERDARTLHLRGCRNETLGFIIALAKKTADAPLVDLQPGAFRRPNGDELGGSFKAYRATPHYAITEDNRRAVFSDALTAMEDSILPEQEIARMWRLPIQVFYAELTIPRGAEPGPYQAKLIFATEDGREDAINLFLDVLPLQLAGRPPLHVELLGIPAIAALYGKDLQNTEEALPIEKAYHVMARDHYATLAIMPYSPGGESTPPFGLPVEGSGLDAKVSSWEAWDERFSPLFDGSGLIDAETDTEPVSHFILPIYENWPATLQDYYTCAEWDKPNTEYGANVYAGPSERIGQCLTHDYWRAFRAILNGFGQHFRDKNWISTQAHIWLNNTPTNRYVGKAPPWALGAPVTRNDFSALEAYGSSFAYSAGKWPGESPLFRVHIPNGALLQRYGRGMFSLLALSDLTPEAWEVLRERAQAYGETLWLQSDALPLAPDRLMVPALGVTYFLQGADGWSIRQVLGVKNDWRRGRDGALIYCGSPWRAEVPTSSLRLKALRRTQQDLELLHMLQLKNGWSRDQLRDFVELYLPDRPNDFKSSSEDWYKLRFAVQELLMR